jgi:hypothetical protein
VRASLVLARDALRVERGPVILLLAAVAVTAAAAVPAEVLPRLGLSLAPLPSAAGALAPSAFASGPARTQAQVLADLLGVLRGVGWTAVAVAALSVLSLFATVSAARGRDLAIHRAVGASRGRILGTLLLEAWAVASAALAIGAGVGTLALGVALDGWPGAAQGRGAWPLALGLLLVAIVLAGRLVPAHAALSSGVRFRDGVEVSLAIPVAQFGVALALVVTGIGLVRGARDVAPSPGGDGAVLRLDAAMLTAPARARLFEALLDAAGGTPSLASGGQAVGLGTTAPLTTHCGQCFRGGIFVQYEPTRAVHHFVSPDTFAASGMPLLAGRTFTREDAQGAARVAIVNRHMALRHFQGGDAVGRNLFLPGGLPDEPYRVVGIVEDGAPDAFGAARQPWERVYFSVLQHPPAQVELLLRGDDAAAARVAALARAAGVTATSIPEAAYRDAVRAPSRWLARWLLAAGAALGIVSALGLASTTWRWVASLGPELAVRRSVGATRGAAMRLVLGRALVAVAQGGVVGLVTLGLGISPMLGDVMPTRGLWRADALVATAAAGLGIALVAAWVPARRLLAQPPARSLD